ncbi:FtsB family cell division protein [Algoriphagus sediminis]|uniref:Septum formation initiator family protein n=1 Tax=Algoriphagus sediminis TaxID=3057113 RepID=A0ABT7YFX4_9BACT|nr:septum formation initiator family protein [Algoriphagus sediminis]MDN3205431.1 septum formation initiator family protein [Algoriphagus sediminis]
MKQIFKYAKNNYILGTLFFLFWMIFIDSNNLVNQYQLSKKLGDLEDQKEYYQERKEIITAQREELLSNPELLEKFAREQYLMKKKTEDLYVIVKK